VTRKSLSPRPSILLGAVATGVLLLGFGGWALLAQLSGAVIAQGQIVVDSRRQIIQHPDGGVVEEVLVRDAQLVERGELLLRLDGASLRTEVQIVDSQLFEVLARMARFRAESANAREVAFGAELTRRAEDDAMVAEQVAGQRMLFRTRVEGQEKQVEQQRKRIDQMLAQIEGLQEQASARRSQFDLLQSEIVDQRSLHARGLTQKSRLLALEREAAEVRGEIGGLDAQVATIGEQIAGVELEVLALDITRREEAAANVQDLAQTHAELAERRKDLVDRIGRLEVRAPSEGIVLGLQEMNDGAVLRAADPLMYLVPQNSPLLVEARISPLQIDEVDVGQAARLVLPGLPGHEAPEFRGHVRNLSADAMLDEATRTSFYRTEILLEPMDDQGTAKVRLLPGMPVEVYIETGKHSPFDYLLKPFTDYFRAALRE